MVFGASLSGESQAVLGMLEAHKIGSGLIGAPLPKSWRGHSGGHTGSWKLNVEGLFTLQELANAISQGFLP